MKKVLISWPRFGPYHIARINAVVDYFAARDCEVVALEISGSDKTYEWSSTLGEERFERITLFPTMAYEDISPREMDDKIIDALDKIDAQAAAVCGYSSSDARAISNWFFRHRRALVLMSETKEDDKDRTLPLELYKSFILRRYTAGICGGLPHRRYLERLGMTGRVIFGKYDVVDNRYFESESSVHRESSKRLMIDSFEIASPYFLACNRFIYRKNLHNLISAYAVYTKQTDRPWPLVLAGSGEEEICLKQLVEQLELKTVYFPGFVQVNELPYYYGKAGAFIHPALNEPWGLVVNEAMACGLPIILSNKVGCAEDLVIDGINGLVFNPLDTADLASCMLKVSSDPVAAEVMGRNSQRIISAFAPGDFAKELWSAFQVRPSLEMNGSSSIRSETRTRKLIKPLFPLLRAIKYTWLWRSAQAHSFKTFGNSTNKQSIQSVFIIGCGRSGTTILGSVLASHRDVHYVFEPYHLWAAVNPETDALQLYCSKEASLVMTDEHYKDGDGQRFDSLFCQPTRKSGRRICLEKTPQNALRIGYLLSLDPKSKFVHIHRDGVDVAHSIERISMSQEYKILGRPDLDQWWGNSKSKWEILQRDASIILDLSDEVHSLKSSYQMGALEWIISNFMIGRYRDRLGGNLLELSYLDFTNSPISTVATIVDFLGLNVDDEWSMDFESRINPPINRDKVPLYLPPQLAELFNMYQDKLGYLSRAQVC